MIFPWFFHDFSMILSYFSRLLNSVLAACVICLNCYYSPKLFYIKRFGHMQPPVVKYQAEKETQVRKNKFCKIYSDIEKRCEWLKQNSMIFPWKYHFFEIPWFLHAWNFFRPNSRFSRWVGTLCTSIRVSAAQGLTFTLLAIFLGD